MADTNYYLTEPERDLLQRFIDETRKRFHGGGGSEPGGPRQAAQVYVASPPCTAGIPARVGTEPGWAECCIFKLTDPEAHSSLSSLEPVLDPDGLELREIVYNVYDEPVLATVDSYIRIAQDRFGRWFNDRPSQRYALEPETAWNCGVCRWTWNELLGWELESDECAPEAVTTTTAAPSDCLCSDRLSSNDPTTTTTADPGTTTTGAGTTTTAEPGECAICPDTPTPYELTVNISGVVNKSPINCSNCNAWNGAWTVTRVTPPSNSCNWEGPGPTNCYAYAYMEVLIRAIGGLIPEGSGPGTDYQVKFEPHDHAMSSTGPGFFAELPGDCESVGQLYGPSAFVGITGVGCDWSNATIEIGSGGPATTTTTTSEPTTTTSTEPTTTSTTTTPPPCRCAIPNFDGAADGECVVTSCVPVYTCDSVTSTTTTTTPEPTTTTSTTTSTTTTTTSTTTTTTTTPPPEGEECFECFEGTPSVTRNRMHGLTGSCATYFNAVTAHIPQTIDPCVWEDAAIEDAFCGDLTLTGVQATVGASEITIVWSFSYLSTPGYFITFYDPDSAPNDCYNTVDVAFNDTNFSAPMLALLDPTGSGCLFNP